MGKVSSGQHRQENSFSSEKHYQKSLSEIAKQVLSYFAETAAKARAALGSSGQSISPSSFAAMNALTLGRVRQHVATINETRERELKRLCEEPAIARVVVLDDSQEERTIFIARASADPPPGSGVLAVSYRAPMGRLAAIPVGGDVEIKTPGGLRAFEVLEHAALKPTPEFGPGGRA